MPLNTKIYLISYCISREDCLWVLEPPSFLPNWSPKNAGTIHIVHFMFEGGVVSPKRAQKTALSALWQIFSSNKSAPANRKKRILFRSAVEE
jgi:hypothetical protein